MTASKELQRFQSPGSCLWVREGLRPSRVTDWQEWLQCGEEHLSQAAADAGEVLGKGRANTQLVRVAGRRGVWRRNHHGGLLGGLLGDRYWNFVRLQQEWQLSEKLRALQIQTPAVLLAFATRRNSWWRQHLVTEEVPEAVTLFAARHDDRALQAGLKFLTRLFDLGLWAPDLHPANLLWQERERRCWLIDLAGARLLPAALSERQRQVRLRRFSRYFAKHAGEVPPPFGVYSPA